MKRGRLGDAEAGETATGKSSPFLPGRASARVAARCGPLPEEHGGDTKLPEVKRTFFRLAS